MQYHHLIYYLRPSSWEKIVDGINAVENIYFIDMTEKVQVTEVQEDNNIAANYPMSDGSVVLTK